MEIPENCRRCPAVVLCQGTELALDAIRGSLAEQERYELASEDSANRAALGLGLAVLSGEITADQAEDLEQVAEQTTTEMLGATANQTRAIQRDDIEQTYSRVGDTQLVLYEALEKVNIDCAGPTPNLRERAARLIAKARLSYRKIMGPELLTEMHEKHLEFMAQNPSPRWTKCSDQKFARSAHLVTASREKIFK